MNAVQPYRETTEVALSAASMREHVVRIQEVMQAVMKENVHYGVIPHTDKPTLLKPGAEVLAATFRIAVSYEIEDLSTDDSARYRVRCIGTHQSSGTRMGEGMGECSSLEEKYKWRRAAGKMEFEATPETRRRQKFGRKKSGDEYQVQQVRTECADVANTCLKMACKRAQVAMTLNVTAASDIFAQDLEDMPDGHLSGEDDERRSVQPPQSKGGNGHAKADDTSRDAELATKGQIAYLRKELSGDDGGPTEAEALKRFDLESLDGITLGAWKEIKKWIADPTPKPEPVAAEPAQAAA